MKPPLIIIGAGRSGTNALRDALCLFEAFQTWPCDEINYIWRHGNRIVPTDQFTRDHARPEVKRFIRQAFERQQATDPGATVVEKTCANSLRVEFVHAVVPEARYLHLVRDGRDVAASACDRWTAPLDLRYLAAKARFVPKTDLTYYAVRYLRTRFDKLRSPEERLSWWGPKFVGMHEIPADSPLVEVAARQWERSVSLAEHQLAALPPERVHLLKYRDFVDRPRAALGAIAEWLDVPVDADELRTAASIVRPGSVAKWQATLSDEQVELIEPIVEPVLHRLGMAV